MFQQLYTQNLSVEQGPTKRGRKIQSHPLSLGIDELARRTGMSLSWRNPHRLSPEYRLSSSVIRVECVSKKSSLRQQPSCGLYTMSGHVLHTKELSQEGHSRRRRQL
jgi:hypothetical protein